jgi:flagellar hook protein FlgE
MSIFGGIRSAVSGLFAQSQSLGQIADNIANVNTTGFKGIRPRFSTLVTTQSSETLHSPGGVQSKVLREIDAQGLLQSSNNATDIAISGGGFFAVNTAADSTGEFLFTRAGSFRADKDGNLVNTGGYFLTGFPITNNVVQQTNILNQLEVVNVANLTASPDETTSIDLGANLQASAAVNDSFDLAVQVLDKQGTAQTLTLTFTKTATNSWDLESTVSGASFVDIDSNDDGATGDEALITGTTTTRVGTVTFNADGTLATVASDTTAGDVATVNASDEFVFDIDYDNVLGTGVADDRVQITLNVGTLDTALGLTQFEGTFTPNFITQDGRQFGSLTGVSISDLGVVTANFDNGETRDIAQIPLVTFNNPNGLEEQSGNVFQETTRSGTATIQIANSGGAGIIAPSALEASTVDIADEFTRMIITQRAFSANTRVISTGDEMLDELVRIVR